VRLAAASSMLLVVPFLAACGNDPVSPRSGGAELDRGVALRQTAFRAAGLSIGIPKTAELRRRRLPGAFRVNMVSGAFSAAWAYRRREPLPRRRRDLPGARRRLARAVKRRDPHSKLRSARETRVASAPAIDLVVDQTLSRTRLRTRSVHVFKGSVEYVLEFFARPADYPVSNRLVFDRMLHSLRVTGKLRPQRRRH
jgi:hypothetical protein